MPKLSINPSLVVLNLQSKNEFPTLASSDKHQFDFKESSFSKALEDATKSKSYERKETASQPKHDPVNPQKDSAYQNLPKSDSTLQQSGTGEENFDSKNQAQVCQTDGQDQVVDDSLTEQPVVSKEVESVTKLEQTEISNANGDNSQLATNPLVAELLANIQPIAVDVEPEASVDGSNPETATSVSEVTFGDSAKMINLKQLDEQPTSVTEIKTNQSVQINPITIAPMSDGKQVEASNMAVVPNLTSIQSQENLTNIQATLSQNQKEASIKSTTAAQNNLQFAELLNNNEGAKLKVEVVSTTDSEAGIETAVKTDGEIVAKTSQGQKETGDFDLLKSFNLKDGAQIELKAQKSESNQTVTAALLMDAKDAKPTSINLPLIQTQLSVNGQTDKVQAGIPVISSVHQQPLNNNTPETNGTTATSVNKSEVFFQIVERAKIMVNNGNSEMEVSLKPEHLGKLQLKVSVENQIVTAKFVAESQQVKEIIETNLSHLRRNLQENGIQVDQLMVSVGQHYHSDGFQQTANYQDSFHQVNRRNQFAEETVDETEVAREMGNKIESDSMIDLIA